MMKFQIDRNKSFTQMTITELGAFIHEKLLENLKTMVVIGKCKSLTFISEQEDYPTHLILIDSSTDYLRIIEFNAYNISSELDKLSAIEETYEADINLEIKTTNEFKIDA